MYIKSILVHFAAEVICGDCTLIYVDTYSKNLQKIYYLAIHVYLIATLNKLQQKQLL